MTRIRRKHLFHIKFWGFFLIMGALPPLLWWIAMLLIWAFMFLFAFGIIGMISPMPRARVLIGLAKRQLMMNSGSRAGTP